MTDYYWASVQLYHEIHSEADVAFREKYIQFLLQCAEYLHCPDLKSMSLDFRRSQRYWKQLGSVLLDEAICRSPYSVARCARVSSGVSAWAWERSVERIMEYIVILLKQNG